MAQKKLITMTQKEFDRHEIINNLISEKINGTAAAAQLNLSIRQTKRLKAEVKSRRARINPQKQR